MSNIEDQVNSFIKAKAALYDYFGYGPREEEYGFEDCRDMFWSIDRYDGITTSHTVENLLAYLREDEEDDCDENDIYQSEVRNTYRGAEYTAVIEDVGTGMSYFTIYDNSREI